MASSGNVLKGSARFEFTSITGMTSPFLLAVPLSPLPDYEFAHPEQRYIWRSLDGSGRNVVTVEGAKAQLFATIRFDDQPDRLREFLRHAMDGDLASLVYKPTSGHDGVSVDIDAVNGQTSVRLSPDRARGGAGEWEAGITLVMDEADIGDLL